MKYLVFGGEYYYPSGGGNDLLESFVDLSLAKKYAEEKIGSRVILRKATEDWDSDDAYDVEWTHVFCVRTLNILVKFGGFPYGTKVNYNERKLDGNNI